MGKSIRKHLLAVLAGACLLFTGLAFAACGGDETACEHTNAAAGANTATCTEAGTVTYTCPDCGASWTEPSEALGHLWDSGTATDTTLCTEARTVTYTCTRAGCDATRTEDLPAAAAHALDEGTVTKEATCTENGVRTFHCTNDGCTYTETRDILAVGEHKLDGGTVTKAATCTTAEEITYKCTACDYTETRTGTAALGHAWDGSAACVERRCTRDGCEESLPATAKHAYAKDNANSVAATCEADGKDVFVCSACNDSYETKVEKLGHTMIAGTPVEGETACEKIVMYTCARGCGYSEQKKTYTHTYVTRIKVEATCAHEGFRHEVCSSCGEVKEGSETAYTDENAHAWNEGVTEGGVTTYTCGNNSAHTKTAIVSEGTSAAVTKEALTSADEVSLGGTLIAMDEGAVAGLGDGEFTLAADTDSYGGAPMENPVYSITLNDGTENITNFEGSVTVSLPYELQDGDNVDAIYIAYIDENGEIEEIVGTYSNGYVTFTTTHFSFYTVRQYTAAQMCEKHGHAVLESSAAATCLRDGYVLRVCTRCGAILENRVVSALGHSWGEPAGSEATCESAGTVTRTCTRCDATSVVVTPAYGHTWVADAANSAAATCTAAGRAAYTCSRCDRSYTETIAALGHALRETVTLPTCTARGFTTYTCTRDGCGYSYTANGVAALGHSWDISEPTCGRGQVCTVCGAAGAPATGEHTMENGVCTVCGQGCDHNFVAGSVVAPTCTARGYTVYTCSACGSTENRNYTEPTGHSYADDWTKCSSCGTANPAVDTVYGNIVKDMMSGEYIIGTEDGSIVYTLASDPDYGQTIVLELFKFVIKFENGKLLFSANGKMEMQEKNPSGDNRSPVEFHMYGDGAYIWMDLYNASIYEDGVGSEYTSLQMGTYESTIFSMFGSGESAEKVAEAVGMLAGLFNGENGTVNGGMKAFMQEFLTGKAADGGYQFTLDHAALKAVNKALYEQTVAAFLDTYFGEGLYDSVIDYIRQNENTTLDGFKKYVLDNLENMGYDRDGIVGIVNTVLTMASGTPTDLDELIAAYPEMTIGQVVCQVFGVDPSQEGALGMILDQLDMMFKGSEESPAPTVYGFLGQMMGIPAETLAVIYDTANEIFDGGNPQFSLRTDANGFISDLAFGASALELTFGEGNYIFDILADVKFDTSEGLEENLGLKTEIAEKTDAVFTAIEAICAENGGTYQLAMPNNGSTITFTLSGGVLSAVIEDVWMTTGADGSRYGYYEGELCVIERTRSEVYIYTIFDASALTMATLQDDCGEAYSVQLLWNASDASSVVKETRYTERYYSVNTQALVHEETRVLSSETLDMSSSSGRQTYCTFYYDPVSGELGTQCFHNYIPAATWETDPETAPCGSTVYWYETCEHCEDVGIYRSQVIQHEFNTSYSLIKEGTSCEDGVLVTRTCIRGDCDYSETDTIYHHERYDEYIEIASADHNNEEIDAVCGIVWTHCACNRDQDIDANAGDCKFDYYETDEDGNDIFRCVVTGCNSAYRVEYTDTQVGCALYQSTRYTFYNYESNEEYRTFTIAEAYAYDYRHSLLPVENDGIEVDNGDGTFTITEGEYCTNCSYMHSQTTTYVRDGDSLRTISSVEINCDENGNGAGDRTEINYDEHGRIVFEKHTEFDENNTDMRWTVSEYDLPADGCTGTLIYTDSNGNNWEESVTVHGMINFTVQSTCTQYGGGECVICNQFVMGSNISGYYPPTGHEYQNGVCIHCGLQNEQGTEIIVLEDLSENEQYAQSGKFVVGVWNRDNIYLPTESIVTLRIVGLTENAAIPAEGIAIDMLGSYAFGLFENNFDSMLYVIDQSEVIAAAEAAGIADFNLEDFGVEVSFVPTWVGETGYVCSITLTNADLAQVSA